MWLGRIKELHFDFCQIQAVKFLRLLCLFGIPTDPQTLFTLKNSKKQRRNTIFDANEFERKNRLKVNIEMN